MKRHFIFLLIVCICIRAYADYRIIFLNTSTININGKQLKVNDTFPPSSTVEWISDKQAMKIVDTKSGEQRLLVASQYRKTKARNIKNYISGVKHLSSRGIPSNVVSLRATLSNHFFFIDSLRIETGFPTDCRKYFYVSYKYKGEEINKHIPNYKGAFIISQDIYTIDNISIPPFDTTLSVFYLDEDKGCVTLITDNMEITVVPDQIE